MGNGIESNVFRALNPVGDIDAMAPSFGTEFYIPSRNSSLLFSAFVHSYTIYPFELSNQSGLVYNGTRSILENDSVLQKLKSLHLVS